MSDSPIPLATMVRVLARLGWNRVGQFREALEFWEPDPDVDDHDFGLERIVLPIDPLAEDAADLIEEASAKLAVRHRDDFLRVTDLIRVMLGRHLDEIDVRRETDNDAGLIRWGLGDQMVDSTRAMLSAAAKATNRPRKRFLNAESTIADDFLKSCYMGQTRIGSYVVTALAPSEELFATSKAERHATPQIAGRAITATLSQSLAAVKAAVEQSGGTEKPDVFEEFIPAGVSFELLQALEPLTEDQESEITVTYFSNQHFGSQIEISAAERQRFSFTPEDGRVIAKARAYFAKTPAPQSVNLVGEVTLLKNSSTVAQHQIKLDTKVHGRSKVVTVNLSAEQYAEAVTAHGLGRMFTVRGELETRARASVMEAPDFVHVEPTTVSAELSAVTTNEEPLFDSE